MAKWLSCVFICSIVVQSISAQLLITVKQDGTGDFTHIQEGVDSATNGDTILVWPGTYFENVLIQDKGVVLGSLTLTTNDPGYINQTIINGNQTGSCVAIDHTNDTTTICGFTITNGSGFENGTLNGGGMFIYYSEPVDIINCKILNNKVTGQGGGIYVHYANLYLSGTTIANNHAYQSAGGLYIGESLIIFDSNNLCNIYRNYSPWGSDLFKGSINYDIHLVLDTFTVLFPDEYYLLSYFGGIPPDDISWEINHGNIITANQDLYVSQDGNNMNSGTTPDAPLKDIWYAILKIESDTLQPDTIHVASGTYKMSTGEKYPLGIKKGVAIKGIHRDSCILDAEGEINHFIGMGYYYEEDTNIISCDYYIGNFTLTKGNVSVNSSGHGILSLGFNDNATFQNLLISNNHSKTTAFRITNCNEISINNCEITDNLGGSGLRIISEYPGVHYSPVELVNCIIQRNVPDYSMPPDEGFLGRGMSVSGPNGFPESAHLFNCLITDNHGRTTPYGANIYGSGLGVEQTGIIVVNCTFGNNTTDSQLGGAVGVVNNAQLNIYNSILYNNEPAEIYMYYGSNELNIYNTLVAGGEEGINVYTLGIINYAPSNIDTDPMWDTTNFYPYSLSSGSPCIDAGTLDLPSGIELPETDLAGNPRVYNGYVDMGAYEYGPWVGIQDPGSSMLDPGSKLLRVWPNPFRFETSISYQRPESGQCIIRIYDLSGRCVKTLMNAQGLSGNGEMKWRGSDDSGNPVPPGTYILVIILNGKEREAVKVVKK